MINNQQGKGAWWSIFIVVILGIIALLITAVIDRIEKADERQLKIKQKIIEQRLKNE
tara:strand:- start:867 stop:1037 length:171 start_codon:yes stop_codon:yes gene_type:complete